MALSHVSGALAGLAPRLDSSGLGAAGPLWSSERSQCPPSPCGLSRRDMDSLRGTSGLPQGHPLWERKQKLPVSYRLSLEQAHRHFYHLLLVIVSQANPG